MNPRSETLLEEMRTPERGGRFARLLFLIVASAVAVAAPWMLGGQPLRAQYVLLCGAAVTFVFGAAVRLLVSGTPGSRATGRILVWPIVFGLAFLGLLLVQTKHPAFDVVMAGNLWKLVPTGSAGWSGPSSISAPFDFLPGDWLPYKNTQRYLLIFGAAWLYAAGLALGFLEREDLRRWLRIQGMNAALLAIVCIAHRATGAKETLWNYRETFDFTGSPVFFYKNHNGAYLAALLALVLGLASFEKERRRLWEATAVALWVATVLVNSRVATAFATLWGVVYFVARWRQREEGAAKTMSKKSLTIGLGAVGAVVALLLASGAGRAVERFAPALSSPLDFLQGGRFRVLIREVGLEIWGERPVWGWGGGSYMYLFNTYESRVPEVKRWMYAEQPNLNRFVSPTVNCDWIEFGVEYGAVGLGLLVAAAAWAVLACFRWRVWEQPGAGFLLAGAGGIAGHAYFDYILRNPALLLLFLGLLVAAVRLAAPRESGRRKSRRSE
jgi:O-antigen ligase